VASLKQQVRDLQQSAERSAAGVDAMTASASGFLNQAAAVQAMMAKEAESLTEAAAMRKAYNAALDQGVLTQEEYAVATAALEKQEEALLTTQAKQALAIEKLAAGYLGGGSAAEKLAADQLRLNEALNAGIISEERYAAASAAIAAEQKALSSAFAQVNLQTSFARQEFGRIGADALAGDFSRLERSSVTLAGHTGILAAAFQFLTSPLGLVTLLVAGLIAVFAVAEHEEARINQTIIATGNYAGVTAGQIEAMGSAVGAQTGKIRDSRAALELLAASGRFSGDELQLVAKSTVDFATVTGKSIADAVKEMVKLRDDPLKAALALNDSYHFLTVATYEQIAAAQKNGDVQQAAANSRTDARSGE
jgi:phage-related minor tail protein